MVASLQDGLQGLLPASWYSYPSCVVPSYTESWLVLCDQLNTVQVTECDFQGQVTKDILPWSLRSLTGGQASCHVMARHPNITQVERPT